VRYWQKTIRNVVAAYLVLISQGLFAHSGGVDSNGGHTESSTGSYHCHRNGCNEARAQVTREPKHESRDFVIRYDRTLYKHWSDFDGDCMNTRHEMLATSSQIKARLSPSGCYVSKGQWLDPFSGKQFTRASDLDVDHIIPLAWAHARGAHAWTATTREQFANDPENLLVVDDGLNQSKGKKGPDQWMPPNQSYRCEYLDHWKAMLSKYSLAMLPKENRIFNRQLQACINIVIK
jgi:hypothetical protein